MARASTPTLRIHAQRSGGARCPRTKRVSGSDFGDIWTRSIVLALAFLLTGAASAEPALESNDCTPTGDGVTDFSYGAMIDLDENDLAEHNGICGWPGWDWDSNGNENGVGLSLDLNSSEPNQGAACGGTLTVLRDFDDWINIDLSEGLADPGREALRTVSCAAPPLAR